MTTPPRRPLDHVLDPARIRVAATFDAAGMDPLEPVALFASIASEGGALAAASRRLDHVGPLDPQLAELMDVFDVECRAVERVHPHVPHLNKLRMLEDNDDVDYVLALDTDIVVLGDPLPFLRADAVAAKPVDQNPLDDDSWTALFAAFGLDVPPARHLTSFHAETVPAYFNSGVVGVPSACADRLLARWLALACELVDRYDELPASIGEKRFFTDQFALALALAELRLPVRALPISCNYPTNEPLHLLHDPDLIRPRILHHHHQLRSDGTLELPLHAAARDAVAVFNARLTGDAPPATTAPAAITTSTPAPVTAPARPAPVVGDPGFDNASYWDERYRTDPELGSGFGSRGELADRKAALIEATARSIAVGSVLDVGCGDLEVVSRAALPTNYLGIDIAREIVERNRRQRPDWSFRRADVGAPDDPALPPSDLVLCLDVLIHQHDADVYRRFLRRLVKATAGVGLVAGYERAPTEFVSATVAFHEPLTESLRAAGATDVEIVDEYRETSVVRFRRPAA